MISQDIRTVDMASDWLISYLGTVNYSIDNILHYPCVELQSVREGINKIIKKRHSQAVLVAKKHNKVSAGDDSN